MKKNPIKNFPSMHTAIMVNNFLHGAMALMTGFFAILLMVAPLMVNGPMRARCKNKPMTGLSNF